MAWGTHAERRKVLETAATKADARAKDHRAREASYRTQGKAEKADEHAKTAARQERIAENHRQEIERLDLRVRQQGADLLTAAQRAAMMERAKERAAKAASIQPAVDPLDAYSESLQQAAALEEEAIRQEKNARQQSRAGQKKQAEMSTKGAAVSRSRAAEWRAEAERIQAGTSRDLAKELKVAIKLQRRLESQDKNERKRRSDLGVVADPLTAAGQREIASGGKGRGVKVASLRDYASLIRKPQERTKARLDTMERFDILCATADAGLYPEPRFEHESGSGYGPGALVMQSRAAGLAEIAQISAGIGARNVQLLRAWIYERSTLTALVRAGFGGERAMGKITLAVLDALTVFQRTQSPLAAAIAGMGLPARPQSVARDADAAGSPQSREGANGSASSQCPRGGRTRPAEPQPWSNRLPKGAPPARATISCSEPISDDARDTILARGTSRAWVRS